jgi:uncharacterized surface protein with fasciclin (FAS1) repeats
MKHFIWWKIVERNKIFLFALLLFGCNVDPVLWDVKSEEQVISQYIANNPEYSEFGKLLESTGLNSILSVRGPFTLFLPSNEVMQAYYTEKGVTSYLDFENPRFIYDLVYTHLILNEIRTGDIGLGAIRDTNALGDFLVTEFQGSNFSDIVINKQSTIIKRDIRCANGYIQLIDKVIDPVTISVYDMIASNPKKFSIFKAGLDTTGLRDTLKVVFFDYGKKVARTRFTILAVTDSIYKINNINNIKDLIDRFTNAPDSTKYLANGFYRYMEYHCLGGTFFLNDFTSRLYPILSYDNNISVTIDTDYKLNFDKVTKEYTGFIIDQSNYPAKNGTIHTLNDILPVIEPAPEKFVFEVTDYFDLKQGDYYKKYYHKWYDGQNDLVGIKWEGDFLQYYYKDHSSPSVNDLNMDDLQMFGFWWIEITTPKIMKGHYTMTGRIWSGNAAYDVYVDGVKTATVKSADPADTTILGDLTWTKTEAHKVKLVATSWGMLFWDTVVFTPVKN